jgi:thiaminase
MMRTFPTRIIEDACMDAERIYNTLVQWYADEDYSDVHSQQIAALNKIYTETLEFISAFGIGAICINGIYREINQ